MMVAFSGVIVVLRPTTNGVLYAAMLPLGSALCYALAAVLTRRFAAAVDLWSLTLSLNIVFVVFGAGGIATLSIVDPGIPYPFLFEAWFPLYFDGLVIILGLAVISLAIHIFLARAYQLGPIQVVASLDFSYLGFAALWSAVIFGIQPGWYTVAGTTLICGAGIALVLRDRTL
jgi:drug/metabolite transporter (DMT)-like permease